MNAEGARYLNVAHGVETVGEHGTAVEPAVSSAKEEHTWNALLSIFKSWRLLLIITGVGLLLSGFYLS